MFLGVEMKVMVRPIFAKLLESSRNGSMWPNANHGNIRTCGSLAIAMIRS